MTNAVGGEIHVGGTASSATQRILDAAVNNLGDIVFAADSTAMQVGQAGAAHSNGGQMISLNHTSVVTFLGNSFVNIAGGKLAGVGELDFSATGLTNDGVITPGTSAGTLTLDGAVTFGSTAELVIELGGTTSGVEYDVLQTLDPVALNGTLSVAFIDGFENLVASGDLFTIVDAIGGRSGTFSGLADGATFQTADGKGFFTIHYQANSVVLSSFSAVPEPGSSAILLSLSCLAITCRRRTSWQFVNGQRASS